MDSKNSLENISKKKDFLVNSASLKDVRSFSRDVFEKLKIEKELKSIGANFETTNYEDLINLAVSFPPSRELSYSPFTIRTGTFIWDTSRESSILSKV